MNSPTTSEFNLRHDRTMRRYLPYYAKDATHLSPNGGAWPLSFHPDAAQPMSFERSPALPFGTRLASSRTSLSPSQPRSEDEKGQNTSGSRNSIYCDIENCEEKCGDECEEKCDDDACSVVRCMGDCNANEVDECEDCLRYRDIPCKEKDCKAEDCLECKPCDEACPSVEKVACVGSICYSPNCDIPPQQCNFQSCFPLVSHSQSQYLAEVGSSLLPMSQGIPMGYTVSESIHFAMPSVEDQYTIDDRYPKRRRTETPVIASASMPTTPSTTASTGFENDPASHSHMASPITDDQLNYLCHWGDSCQMGFSDYFALDNHVVQTHIRPQIGFACQWEACGEAEKDLSHLLDHVKASHTSNTNQGNGHVCLWQGCNATFTNSEDLSHHLTNVHLQSPIGGLLCQWEACGIQADGPDGLTTHLHRDHFLSSISEASGSTTTSSASYCTPPLDQTLVCQWAEVEGGPICGKQFATADALQVHAKDDHIAILKKKTGYFCRWAGCTRREKEFSQKGKVERHMQTHTGFKSCRCPHCDKEFSAPQALQQHIRTHTGEKPYKCDICGKEFAQGSAMTMHKRVHTGERPLKCDYPGCNKRFSESSNLSKHRKTHNPVGQHRCGFPGCERSFHRLDQMKRHQKTHGAGFVVSPPEKSSAGIIPEDIPLPELVQV